MSGNADGLSFPTSLGTSTADEIRLLGQNLTADLMGQVSFGELAFWLVALRRPSPSETRVFEAVLVALADHGFTPTAIAARLTYLSAPDSLQGALAAGLLGGGSRFLGVTEDCGLYLHEVLQRHQASGGTLPDGRGRLGRAGPGGGPADPGGQALRPRPGAPGAQGDATPGRRCCSRSPSRRGCAVRTCGCSRPSAGCTSRSSAAGCPLNGAGVCGAALADLGLPVELLRGFALLARAAGLLGQIAEERRRPIGMDAYLTIDRNAVYVNPDEP